MIVSYIRNGWSGISLVFLTIINDELEMKSIDKQHSKFLAGLTDDEWDKSTLDNDLAQGFKSVFSCKPEVHRKGEAMYTF